MKNIEKIKKNGIEDYVDCITDKPAARLKSAGNRKHLYPDLYKQVIESIKSDRKAQNITQRELARKLRTVPSWIAKNETGERRLDLIEMLDIYTSLGVDPMPLISDILRKIDYKKSFDKK